jgi:plastocyanin
MRALSIAIFAALVGCSPTVANPPADGGAQTDTPAVDTPAVDRVDAPAVTDAPGPVDRPVGVDAPAPVDTPAPIDVPADRSGFDAPDAPCASPLLLCGGACVDRQTDSSHCGACGVACPAAARCTNGSCLGCGACTIGRTCCGTACVDLNADQNHCGSCGTTCPVGRPCTAGTCIADDCPGGQFCGGVCVRTSTDSANCGACGQRCCAGNVCIAGTCTVSCSPGNVACPSPILSCRGSFCANPAIDAANCGACGHACATGEACLAGACRGPGFTALAPCTSAGDYAAASTVRFGGALGSAYSPRCVTVRVGDTLTWEGAFSSHPLSPSTRGTAANPIARTTTGTSAPVRFPRAGFYPFYCEFHGNDAGGGMSGVVQVIE